VILDSLILNNIGMSMNRREFMRGVGAAIIAPAVEATAGEVFTHQEFPSETAIAETLRRLLEGREGKVIKRFEDEQGIIACDIEFTLEDGETATLEYMRKGRHEVMGGSSSARTNIYVTFFDNGFPVGGTNVAEYVDGEWKVDDGALNSEM